MNNFVPGTVVASSPLVPSVSLYFLLRKITEITGVTITGPALYNPDFQALVLPSIREVSTGALPIASILPEIKLSEFFIELRKILNLNFSFSGITRTLTISFLQISNSEITNWQSIASASEKKIAEQNSRLSIAFTPDPGDALFKDTPPQIQIAISESPNIPAGGITPIVSKFSSILKDTATGLGKIDQPGISNINGQQDKKQGLRIAYIHAASTTYTAHFESPSGLLNLTPSALLAGPYSQLANIRANAFYLKKKMMLTEAHIAAINFSTPIFFNGLLWLLLSASPTFPITEPTECLFVKI